jgi:hypothetical protein
MNSLWSDTQRMQSMQHAVASCDDTAISADRGDSFVSLTGMESVGRQDSMISVMKIDAVLGSGVAAAAAAAHRDCSPTTTRETPDIDRPESYLQCAAV